MARENFVGVRLTNSEMALLYSMSQSTGMSLSEIIRRAVVFCAKSQEFNEEIQKRAELIRKHLDIEAQIEQTKHILRKTCLFDNQQRILSRLARRGLSIDDLVELVESFNKELELSGINLRHDVKQYIQLDKNIAVKVVKNGEVVKDENGDADPSD